MTALYPRVLFFMVSNTLDSTTQKSSPKDSDKQNTVAIAGGGKPTLTTPKN